MFLTFFRSLQLVVAVVVFSEFLNCNAKYPYYIQFLCDFSFKSYTLSFDLGLLVCVQMISNPVFDPGLQCLCPLHLGSDFNNTPVLSTWTQFLQLDLVPYTWAPMDFSFVCYVYFVTKLYETFRGKPCIGITP